MNFKNSFEYKAFEDYKSKFNDNEDILKSSKETKDLTKMSYLPLKTLKIKNNNRNDIKDIGYKDDDSNKAYNLLEKRR